MIWLFWSLVGLVVIGLPILAILARRNRSPLRPAGPTAAQVLRAAGRTWMELLWAVSHPFGTAGRHRRGPDATRDYIREKETRGQGRRNPSDPK